MGERKMEDQEKRRYYRIEYPASMKPTLKIRKHEFEVLNISEKGVMFLAEKEIKFGRWVRGTVTFNDSQTVGIEGKIVRNHGNNIGMFLTVKAIPYSRILSEQRLLAHFNLENNPSSK